MRSLVRWLPMIATAAYMAAIAAGFIAFKVNTRLSSYHIKSLYELVPFIVLATTAFYCYFAASLSTRSTWTTIDHTKEPIYQAQLARAAQIRPSFVKPADPKDNNPSCLFPSIETKRNNCRRFCRTCEAFKPDRSHHCHSCNRCLLGSDHHCVFLNNCIALHNRKLFVLFLFYASLACSYVSAHIILTNPVQIVEQRNIWTAMFTVALFVMAAASSIAVMGFMSLHLWLIAKNMTTIDLMEKQRKHRMSNRINPFSISLIENICFHMGPVWSWLLPINIKSSRPQGVINHGQIWNEMRDSGIVFDMHPSYVHPQNGWLGVRKSEAESTGNDEVIEEVEKVADAADASSNLRQRVTTQNGNE